MQRPKPKLGVPEYFTMKGSIIIKMIDIRNEYLILIE